MNLNINDTKPWNYKIDTYDLNLNTSNYFTNNFSNHNKKFHDLKNLSNMKEKVIKEMGSDYYYKMDTKEKSNFLNGISKEKQVIEKKYDLINYNKKDKPDYISNKYITEIFHHHPFLQKSSDIFAGESIFFLIFLSIIMIIIPLFYTFFIYKIFNRKDILTKTFLSLKTYNFGKIFNR